MHLAKSFFQGPTVGALKLQRALLSSSMRDDYFKAVRSAMLKARHRIMLVGWDFDARISLDRTGRDLEGPDEIAALLQWLVGRNQKLEIYILRWDVGALKSLLNMRTLIALARWIWHPRISIELDGNHPVAASHHQKIVVIDDCLAFCGGIDMTGRSLGTRARTVRLIRFGVSRTAPPISRGTMRPRLWKDPSRQRSEACVETDGQRRAARRSARSRTARICWPDHLEPMTRDVRVAISRTIPAMPGSAEIIEIRASLHRYDTRARCCIYIENQYLASRQIAIALAQSLDATEGPEIVIISPISAEGWIEPLAMDTARARLHEALRRRDRCGRFRLYHPVNEAGTPIYVPRQDHGRRRSDDPDRLIEFEQRSLGLDTECDVTFDAALSPDRNLTSLPASLRLSLVAEHLNADPVGCQRSNRQGRFAHWALSSVCDARQAAR